MTEPAVADGRAAGAVNPKFTDDGGLMVYRSPSSFAMSHRLASFVDRILKGAKPTYL